MTLSDEQRALLERFLDEAYRWNRRMNLTAVPEEEAWSRHIEESRELLRAARVPQGARLVDVGSGMGVPGIPVAVVRPDVQVALVESDVRKAGFLVHVAGLLELGNARVVNRRAEELGRDAVSRESFDTALSRGVAASPVLCELALPLLRVGGRLHALVAAAETAAAECRHAAHACGGGDPTALTDGILSVVKARPTPDTYPRRPGVPARHPLMRM